MLMALLSPPCPTISFTNTERAGESTTATQPMMSALAKTCHTTTTPVIVSAASAPHATALTAWVETSRRRLG